MEFQKSKKINAFFYKIESLLNACFTRNHHFFLWRLPNKEETLCLINFDSKPPTYPKHLFTKKNPGFVFHNFKGSKKHFFQAHLLYNSNKNQLVFPTKESSKKNRLFYQNLLKKNPPNKRENSSYFKESTWYQFKKKDISKDFFIKKTALMIKKIKEKKLEKIVFSRQKTTKLNKQINLISMYKKLLDNNPDSFVFLCCSHLFGTWIGASPEILIELDKKILKTISLAGTQTFNKSKKMKDVLWSQKEIEEQALVTKYIIECFKSIRLREFDIEGPRSIQAGNLLHLKSFFTINLKKLKRPFLAESILKLIQPTSAVCGIPKKPSQKLINTYEPHDRSYYSGFLGPVNLNDQSHLFVNIRSLQAYPSFVVSYAGAGITRDSNPLKEWQETEWKINAILKTIL